MQHLSLIPIFCLLLFSKAADQHTHLSDCPTVTVTVKLFKDSFSIDDDILLTITLTNKTKKTQSVWFDKPKSSGFGPAWTTVSLINKKTRTSVLKYANKSILKSETYTPEQVKGFSYILKPEQSVSGQFSLYNLAVVKNSNRELSKGTYEIQIFYCSNPSAKISFTVN